MTERTTVPVDVKVAVLTECGYRCAVPTCRQILAIDLHHIVEVSEGGGNAAGNLLALCPTCHALLHRGTIRPESIRAWKIMTASLNGAFDRDTVDKLHFLADVPPESLWLSGDGVLAFSKLVSAGFASFRVTMQNGPLIVYGVRLTERGAAFVQALRDGDLQRFVKPNG